MRAFIGLFLEAAAQQLLQSQMATVTNRLLEPIRLVAPANYHVTCHFFDNLNACDIQNISHDLGNLASQSGPVGLAFDCWACLPLNRHPRVLIAKLKPSDQLLSLANNIKDIVRRYGYMLDDRAFMPHITVAHLNPGEDSHSMLPELDHAVEHFTLKAGQVNLMQSQLSHHGAEYTSLCQFTFI